MVMSFLSVEEFKETLGKLLVMWTSGETPVYTLPQPFNCKVIGFSRVIDPSGGSSG